MRKKYIKGIPQKIIDYSGNLVIESNKPSFISYYCGSFVMNEIKCSVGQHIKRGDTLAYSNIEKLYPIISSSYGVICEISDLFIKVKVDCFEKDSDKKNVSNIKKIEISEIESLMKNGLIADYYTGKSFINPFGNDKYNFKYVVINCLDTYPFIFSKYMDLTANTTDFICGLEIILKYYQVRKAYLIIPPNEEGYYRKLFKLLLVDGLFELKLLKNNWPYENKSYAIHQIVTGKNKKNDSVLESVLYIDPRSCIDLGYFFQYGYKINKRIITVSVPGKKILKFFDAYIGTPINDILAQLCIDNKNSNCFVHLISGAYKKVDECFSINEEIDGIIIDESKMNIISADVTECDYCGKCLDVCPQNIPIDKLLYKFKYISAGDFKKISECDNCCSCDIICHKQISITKLIKTTLGGKYEQEEE